MSNYTHCRFLHNILIDKSVNLTLIRKGSHRNEVNINNLEKDESTAYTQVEAGTWYLIVTINDLMIRQVKILVKPQQHYTFVLSGRTDRVRIYAYQDDLSLPDMGFAKVRFIHQVDKLGNVDFVLQKKKVATLRYGQESSTLMVPITNLLKLDLQQTNNKKPILQGVKLYLFNRTIYNFIFTGTEASPKTIILKYESEMSESLQKNFCLDRYMGSWQQVAGIPQPFDHNCAISRADYCKLEQYVKVVNTCLDSNNCVTSCLDSDNCFSSAVEGKAFVPNSCQPAALTVCFFDQCDKMTTQANYLIHLTDYDTYSLVGHPDRQSLYFLSRDGKMKISQYRSLLRYARSLGYPIERIKIAQHALYP